MVQLLDISAKRRSHRGWHPRIREQRSKQRLKRRLDQEIVYVNNTYLGYSKNSFGQHCLNKNLWNEGFDYLAKVIVPEK